MKKVLFAIIAIVLCAGTIWSFYVEEIFIGVCNAVWLVVWCINYIQFREIRELNKLIDIFTQDAMRNKKSN